MSTTITRAAREALAGAVCDGNQLTIPGRMPPRDYAEVKRVLETAGARWNTSAQAHIFPGDAAEALAGILAGGQRVTGAAEAEQWYPTPAEVAEELLDLAQLQPGLEVLEPSAGQGAIAEAVVSRGCLVDCIESHPGRAAHLEDRNNAVRLVTCADFLTVPPRPIYDRVIMNPPFKGGADTRHVLHALRFVKPGGLLVAVMGAGVTFRKDAAAARVRELASGGGRIERLPDDAFKVSGAGLPTVIAVIPVPDDRPALEGEPVRVTFDHTAEGLPLFIPAAARVGRYVYDGWGGPDQVFTFGGYCVGCGARTWAYEGANGSGGDIRGPFGYNTCVPIDSCDLDGEPVDVPGDATFPRCAECYNERGYEGYRKAIDAAVRQLRTRARAPQLTPATVPVPARAEQLDIFAVA